ncbi:MAG: Ig-like domain-containing protein [Eubacterium sp.]|nr:Ig-like domain-containing protein [Eubacterium sp.]
MRNRLSTSLLRICALAMVLVMCISLLLPGKEVFAASGKVQSVTVSNLPAKSLTLKKGKSFKLKTKVSVSGNASKKVTYKSSKKSVATVNSKGKITAKKKGTAKITITSQADKKKKYVVTVKVGTPVKKVTLNQKTAILKAGARLNLKATLSPKKPTNKKVVWSSGNENVAKVDSKGVVTAVNAGTAKITCTAADGSNKKAVCTVTVTKPQATAANTTTKAAQTTANTSSTSSGTPSTTPSTTPPAAVKVSSITIADAPEKMKVDEKSQLKVTVLPDNAANKSVSFTSSDEQVLKVDTEGNLEAVNPGEAVITVTAKDGSGISAKVNITVAAVLRGLDVSDNPGVLEVGDTATIKYGPIPETVELAPESVQFISSNVDVVSVDEGGNITAQKPGSATITVSAEDKEGNKQSAVISITVRAKIVHVTGISTDSNELALNVDEEKQVSVTVEPANANDQTVAWTSSNEAVATVSNNGTIKAVAVGEATITATTKDGDHAVSIAVTVNAVEDKNRIVASTQEEIEAALKNAELQELIIQTNEAGPFTIPEGSHKGTVLRIQAPNGHVENRAAFKSVFIESIGSSTYVECASGNEIYYASESGRVEIAEGASASLVVSDGAGALSLENNGTITRLTVLTTVTVNVSGASTQNHINTQVAASAENAAIITNQALELTANTKIDLTINAGAEDTIAVVDTSESVPAVTGLGKIQVTVLDTTTIETVVGQNQEEQTQKIKVSGSITDSSNNAIVNAQVAFIPYLSEINAKDLNNCLDKAASIVETDENGAYLTDEIPIGNYYMYVTADDYQAVEATTVITSNNTDTYNAGSTVLVKAGEGETGTLSGTLYNAQNGREISDQLTLYVRSGGYNTSGDPLLSVETNEDGTYLIENLEPGLYTIQVVDNRESEEGSYVTTNFNAVVEAGSNTQNATVTYLLASDQVRFILRWGDEASGASRDLDSHLVGPGVKGGQFHTWYSEKTYYAAAEGEESIKYADLDVDDTTWEGPETTTIYRKTEGLYHFYIHDFSNGGNPESSQMSRSNATVRVVVGSRELAVYNVPNQPGNLWDVCTYDAVNGKLTPINQVIGFDDDESDIGVDLVLKYRDLLGKQIAEVEQVIQEIKDEELLASAKALIEEAKEVYNNEEATANELKEQYNLLRDWLDEQFDAVRINSITGKDGAEISDWWYGDEDSSLQKNLVIEGYSKEVPELEVTVPEGSTAEIKTSDRDDTGKMIVVTSSAGITCNYYINYARTSSVFEISNVEAYEGGTNLIRSWYCDWDSDDDVDDENIYVLCISGYTDELPGDDILKITPWYSKAEVAINVSEKTGYSRKVTVSYDGDSRDYYVIYSVANRCEIGSVNAYDESENNLIYSYDYDWEEDADGNEINILEITGYAPSIPETLTVTPAYEKASASMLASDKAGYDKMVTVTCGEESKQYYITYETTEYSCAIRGVNAERDGVNLISDWDTDYEYDDDDNRYYELYLYDVTTNDLGSDLVITPQYTGANVSEIQESDKEGYDGKIVITNGSVSRTYYLKLNMVEILDRQEIDSKAIVLEAGGQKTAEINEEGDCIWYKFVPEESGTYTIYAEGEYDNYVELFDADDLNSSLAYNDDGGNDTNFQLTWDLEADKTYYYRVKMLSSSETGSFEVFLVSGDVEEAQVSDETDEEQEAYGESQPASSEPSSAVPVPTEIPGTQTDDSAQTEQDAAAVVMPESSASSAQTDASSTETSVTDDGEETPAVTVGENASDESAATAETEEQLAE